MNTTTNAGEPPYNTTNDTRDTEVNVPHSLGFFFLVLFLFITLSYGAYIKKMGYHSRSPPRPQAGGATIALGNDDQHAIQLSQGLDDGVLVSFPTFVYSELMMSNDNEDHARDAPQLSFPQMSACSICLANYKPVDVLRLLPQCGHLFHVSCIDTWLKVHPTCPVCRDSPLHMV